MTIAELVDQLAMFDPETQVFVETEGGVIEPSVRRCRVNLDDDPDESAIVQGVVLARRSV